LNSNEVTHAEIASAAAYRPEQILVLVGAGLHPATVGEHDFGALQIVERESMLADEPAEAATQRQASHTGN
jgi:hypothetical protein